MKSIYSIIFLVLSLSTFSQNLRTIETYYDPYRQAQIKERYTVETQRMQKHGLYQLWDEFGSLAEETQFSNGKKQGVSTKYWCKELLIYNERSIEFEGKVSIIENYKDGKLHGKRKNYQIDNNKWYLHDEKTYQNGNLISETEYYLNGKKKHLLQNDGLCEKWYENGRKQVEYSLNGGFEQGKATSWYENGQIDVTGSYSNGVYVGDWIAYFPDGNLKRKETYWDETGLILEKKEYARNNKLAAEIKSIGEGSILFILYDTITNTPISKENMKYKIGSDATTLIMHGESSYYSNGREISRGNYNEDKRVGFWKIYYDKDFNEIYDLDSAQFYREVAFNESGNPEGKVVDYYISGEKQWEGTLLSINPDIYDGESFYYYPNGQLQSHQFHNNNLRSGEWKSYYQNGQLVEQFVFVQDKPDGDYQQFWENGKLKQEGTYKLGKFIGEWKDYKESGDLLGITYYNDLGIKVDSKASWQLEQENVDKIRQNINIQRTQLRQRFVLNSPTAQEKQIGDSYEIVFNSVISKANNLENRNEKVKVLKRLQSLGEKLLKLDDKSIKTYSKQLKNQNSPNTILRVFGIN